MAKKTKEVKPILLTNEHVEYDTLNKFQKQAFSQVLDWYHSKKNSTNLIFRLGGAAGSGKSYFIRCLIEYLKLSQQSCYVVSYTGQAVNVLRRSGIFSKTIHSTFMRAEEEQLRDDDGKIIVRRGVPVMTTRFRPLKHIPAEVKLVICDEASFLPEDLEKTLSKYNVPILEVGDPIQLPPVSGKQCFNMDVLDFFMDGIMRQEADSEIIDLATRLRYGMDIDLRAYSKQVRFIHGKWDVEDTFDLYRPFFKHSDVILTTTNKDRNIITKLYREKILKADSPYPMKGEKLICRKNDWNLALGDFPLTNGTQGTAVYRVGKSMVDEKREVYTLDFQPNFISNDYYDGILCDTQFLRDPYGDKPDWKYKYNPGKKFEYGHAITTHLAQGSQYNNVLFLDKTFGDPEYQMRLRYTAVTRAVEKLTYVVKPSRYCDDWAARGLI